MIYINKKILKPNGGSVLPPVHGKSQILHLGRLQRHVKSHVDSGTQEPSMVDLPTFAINLWYMVGTYASPMDRPGGKRLVVRQMRWTLLLLKYLTHMK